MEGYGFWCLDFDLGMGLEFRVYRLQGLSSGGLFFFGGGCRFGVFRNLGGVSSEFSSPAFFETLPKNPRPIYFKCPKS